MKYITRVVAILILTTTMHLPLAYNIDLNTFEERKDNQWTIDKGMMPNDVLILSVNGQVTHGDRLQYRMMKDCKTVNVLTTFITGHTPPNVEEKLLVNAKYNEEDIQVYIPFISKSGSETLPLHFVWVDLGWYSVGKIKNYHKDVDTIELTLQDKNTFKTDEYLTVKTNSWTTQGMAEGLDRAIQYCKDSQKVEISANNE